MTSTQDKHHLPSLPPIPDLRFEYSYLRRIEPYHQGSETQWGRIVWATILDQVISPMLQGAIWCVSMDLFTTLFLTDLSRAIAGVYLTPYAVRATALLPTRGEGAGSKRLRGWAQSWGLGAK